ncbi:RWD domain-containing protein 2A [Diabrotica virgifera virgifera]|uniref:RWD domain-containing protein 2A n=1 Tax=Diabrotica virgifera virgifera TaxID=50390 RepID=A0A6P7FTM2_DIAVI|nr:RWD domain-containing protein 2A [Diabrotica virgifera virgifera]XP_050515290.1 RWD domain-containing protein 2A [Diabrotica virgifera virgifera]
MTKISSDQLKSNLEIQLSELEILESLLYNPGELKVEDICTLSDIRDYVNDKTTISPPYLDITVNIIQDNAKFELCITLPHEYPNVEPELFVRNHKFDRHQHVKINKDLCDFMACQEKGEPCIFSAISWIKDNAEEYIRVEQEQPQKKDVRDEKFVRHWIYSHHIYSKTKRRELVELANQLELTGFCMPGKPGIICIEGAAADVQECWQAIKSMSWKKIFCKVIEDDKEEEGRKFLKFDKFEEVVFQNNGIKYNHMDMGELHHYLEDHSVGYIFKDLFGVEARSSTSS